MEEAGSSEQTVVDLYAASATYQLEDLEEIYSCFWLWVFHL